MSSKQNALLVQGTFVSVANKGKLSIDMHADISSIKKLSDFHFLFIGIINLKHKLLYLY